MLPQVYAHVCLNQPLNFNECVACSAPELPQVYTVDYNQLKLTQIYVKSSGAQ